MRYRADVAVDAFNRREGIREHHVASVSAYPIANERLAARHARAMAAVLRAAKAYGSGRATLPTLARRHHDLCAAVARLEKVEKEVGRG